MTAFRAFLSHSSVQKDFVRAVAVELGRQFCQYDEYSFSTGDEFHEAIRRGLADSKLFVLFASKETGESFWVGVELDEAEKLAVRDHIERGLVYLMDPSVSPSDLPLWLRKSLMTRPESPKAAARAIRDRLDSMYRARQQPTFVGRTKERAEAERLLLPADGSIAPRVFVVWGLSGIGRKTLTDRIGRDLLHLDRCLQVRLESGDTIQDVCAKLAVRFEPAKDADSLREFVNAIERLSTSEAEKRAVGYLATAIRSKELPVLVDAGGLLDNDGRYVPAVDGLIRAIAADPQLYASIVSERRPEEVSLPSGMTVPQVRVNQLSADEIKRLLAAIGQATGPTLSAAQMSELADYLGGFPPAAHYAMRLARDYGIDVILADKARLVDFRARAFVRYLSTDVRLSPEQKQMLALLAAYNPLPLSVIALVLGFDSPRVAQGVIGLVDAALVWPGEAGLYWLAAPVVEAVARVIGTGGVDHAEVTRVLGQYLDQADPADRVLELSKSLYKARRYSGAPDQAAWEVGFASDVIELTKRSYHERRYEEAIQFGREATSLRPLDVGARDYLVRALIQEERYDEAEAENARLKDLGALRDHYFLAGFLERHRGRYDRAIANYTEAVKRGRRGVAVHRELAQCYFSEAKVTEARRHIDIAQSFEQDNRYVVDLKAQIAIASEDETVARQQLSVLKTVDTEAHYQHRRSTVEFAFGSALEALIAALAAVKASGGRPPFHLMTQLAKCQIETKNLEDARVLLDRIARMYSSTRQDIQRGLRCKWETAAGNYAEALRVWDSLGDKLRPVHKALKVDALRGLLKTGAAGANRATVESELVQLEAELVGQRGWIALG